MLRPGGTFLVCNESDGTDVTAKKFEGIIEGMKCYTPEEIEAALKAAGSQKVTSTQHPSKHEYYTDLLNHLRDIISVEHANVHFIYANKMGEKYRNRYKKYFRDLEIREFNMQHEQWLFGGEKYAVPVLKAIDEFMETPV